MIVCQDTPSWAATRDTARSWWPTCSNAHCCARSVSTIREAIASCCSVQVFLSHKAYRRSKTRLYQRTTTGMPPAGRSRTVTVRRSFARATGPQVWAARRLPPRLQLQVPLAVEHLAGHYPESGQHERTGNVIAYLRPSSRSVFTAK